MTPYGSPHLTAPAARFRPVRLGLALLLAAGGTIARASASVPIRHRPDIAPCVAFGIHDLESALGGVAAGPGGAAVVVESLDQPAFDPARERLATAVPDAAESFTIARAGDTIAVLGRDAIGTMYGALELAEQVGRTHSLAGITRTTRQPFLRIRGVNQFVFEEALLDPKSWFFQDAFWDGYFAQLARTRHNLLDLHAGYQLLATNFPSIYPYFIALDEFPGQCVGRAAAERNLAMLQRIIAIGERHGVHVALMNYTVQGVRNADGADMFAGFDQARFARYTYLAAKALLQACPDLWMYGFRIGESGQPEDFYQNTYLAALADSGYRGRLYTRSWLATRKNIEAIQQGFHGKFLIEVKYNGEHLGLPYQAITSPTRFDPSYSYEAYTDQPRGFELLYQVRANGTHRIFHWGDPEFVARVARSCRLGEAAGYSVEPMTAYYPMTDAYHPAAGHHYFQWTWQRDWYWYALWGRLGYDPATPPDVFEAMFNQRFGAAGGPLWRVVTASSRVVPLVYSAVTLGPDQRQWAPEFETGNPDIVDLQGLHSFGGIDAAIRVPPLDPTVMCSATETAAAEIADQQDGRVELRATARELWAIAAQINTGLADIPEPATNSAEAECLRLDAQALASLARFAAERYLAMINLAEYRLTSFPWSLSSAYHHLWWAREHWRRLAEIADGHYAPLLESLRMRTQAYRWASQLPILDGDLAHLTDLEQAWDPRWPDPAAPALAHLPGRGAAIGNLNPASAARPVEWRDSEFEPVRVDGQSGFKSARGCIGFAIDDLLLNDTDADCAVDLEYWDPGAGTGRALVLKYDGVAGRVGSLVEAGTISLGRRRGWQHAHFTLPHARFAGAGAGNSDLVITASDGGELIVGAPRLSVVRTPEPALDLYVRQPRNVANAWGNAPAAAMIHWRVPGGPWDAAPLAGRHGVKNMDALPRGREVQRFVIPPNITQCEYYFTADVENRTERLPRGDAVYHWRKYREPAPPVLSDASVGGASHRAGPVELRVHVTARDGVARVIAYYKPLPSDLRWQELPMAEQSPGVFTATAPLTAEGLMYRFAAWDRDGNAVQFPDFRVETPYRVIPAWDPHPPQKT